jgi:malonyl-CoA O-methyltransferase
MVARKLELRRCYGETAWIYDQRYEEIQRGKYSLIFPILPHVDRILDLGCGSGLFLGALAKRGRLIVGVDSSPEMLEIAKRRPTRAALLLADADHLPFADQSFDVVVSVTLLQNMPNPEITVREAARVMKLGGIMALTVLKRKHSPEELEEWVRGAGLEPLEVVEEDEDVCCIARR